MFKKILTFCFALAAWHAAADGPVVQTTPFSRGLLQSQNATAALAKLGVLATNNWPITNANLVNPVSTNPTNVGGVYSNGTFYGLIHGVCDSASNNLPVFNVKFWGAVGDGVTDDSIAVSNTIQAAYNAGGGIVFFPGSAYFLPRVIFIPHGPIAYYDSWDGGSNFWQPTIRLTGVGNDFSGNLQLAPTNGTILLLDATNAIAKIQTIGRGTLEIDHLSLYDARDGTSPFILDTCTTLYMHNFLLCGKTAAHPGGGIYPQQDGIILGGTNAVSGLDVTNAFQGYGTVIADGQFDRLRRVIYFRTWANAVPFENNIIWLGCGGDCAIEIDGGSFGSGGNIIANNTIEAGSYTNAMRLANTTYNKISGNSIWDFASFYVTPVHFMSTATGNFYDGPDTPVDDSQGQNLWLSPDGVIFPSSLSVGTTNNLATFTVFNQEDGPGYIQELEYSSGYYLICQEFVTGGNVAWVWHQMNNTVLYTNVLSFNKGNIGIGTNAASQPLEVNGNTKVDATLTAAFLAGDASSTSNTPAASLTGLPPWYRAGLLYISAGTLSHTNVLFSSPLPSTNYSVSLACSSPSGATVFVITNMTTAGFYISDTGNFPSADTIYWQAILNQ